jgi:hypothetical protein
MLQIGAVLSGRIAAAKMAATRTPREASQIESRFSDCTLRREQQGANIRWRRCENRNGACDIAVTIADSGAKRSDELRVAARFRVQGDGENKRRSRGTIPISRLLGKFWSGRRGSNPRPRPWQGRALPLSYTRIRKIAGDRADNGQSYAKCGSRMQQPARNLEPPKNPDFRRKPGFSPEKTPRAVNRRLSRPAEPWASPPILL